MHRFITRSMCVSALILMATFALAQTEFSADIVDVQKEGTPTQAKIYFAKDKLRIESQEQHNPKGSGVFIMDMANQNSIILMPQQHM